MRWFIFALVASLSLAFGPFANGEDRVFEGPWKTTNRKLDGIMTCVLKDLGEDKWQGRFYGIWQGVPFDYTVKFTGSPQGFKGTAVVDFADYTWTGSIDDSSPAVFNGKFGGSRYTGFFALKEQKKAQPATATTAAKPRTTSTR